MKYWLGDWFDSLAFVCEIFNNFVIVSVGSSLLWPTRRDCYGLLASKQANKPRIDVGVCLRFSSAQRYHQWYWTFRGFHSVHVPHHVQFQKQSGIEVGQTQIGKEYFSG